MSFYLSSIAPLSAVSSIVQYFYHQAGISNVFILQVNNLGYNFIVLDIWIMDYKNNPGKFFSILN